MKTFTCASLALLLVACGSGAPDPTSNDADRVCDRTGQCTPSACRAQEYWEGPVNAEGLRVDWAEGEAVFVAGFQLSLMLTPTLSASAGGRIEPGCVQVSIEHRPDHAYPEESFEPFTFVTNSYFVADGSMMRAESAIFDAFREELADRHMIVDFVARGASWRADLTRNVRVVDENGYQPCDAYPVVPDRGTFSRTVEGSVVFGEATFDACDSEADVAVTFTPTESVDGCTLPANLTVRASRDCLARRRAASNAARLILLADGTLDSIDFGESLVCACD